MKTIKIGWAQTSISAGRPLLMIGQMYHRVSEYVRDPITATALALDNGETQAVFVSVDMTEYPTHITELLKEKLSAVADLRFESISIGATHTHNSSDFYSDFMRDDNEHVFSSDILPPIHMGDDVLRGKEAQAFLVERLASVITRAWQGRREGGISYAHDYAAVGFNRRPIFHKPDGAETIMYGDCSRDDFAGFEGGADSSVDMLYTWDMDGGLTGVAVDVPCPSQVFELHRFITADYWGFTRAAIRESLGNVHILSLCGAAGDISPLDLVRISKYNKQALQDWGGQTKEVLRNFDMTRECEGIAARVTDAVVRGYKAARNYIDYTPAFVHEVLQIDLPLRLVSQEEYETSCKEIERIKQTFSKERPMETADVVRAFEPQGDVLRWELQQKTKVFPCVSHFVRIGEIGIMTNPFELYHEYAQRMKARVKAQQLFVVQLSNGLGGYLPTEAAVHGGSYSSKPASTICGPEGGNMLVEKAIEVLNSLF